MPVYSLYSFHRTFIPGFEYLTPWPSTNFEYLSSLSHSNMVLLIRGRITWQKRPQMTMPVYSLFTELLSPVSSTWPQVAFKALCYFFTGIQVDASLYSFYRTFIPAFEYLTPSGSLARHHLVLFMPLFKHSFMIWVQCSIRTWRVILSIRLLL